MENELGGTSGDTFSESVEVDVRNDGEDQVLRGNDGQGLHGGKKPGIQHRSWNGTGEMHLAAGQEPAAVGIVCICERKTQ